VKLTHCEALVREHLKMTSQMRSAFSFHAYHLKMTARAFEDDSLFEGDIFAYV